MKKVAFLFLLFLIPSLYVSASTKPVETKTLDGYYSQNNWINFNTIFDLKESEIQYTFKEIDCWVATGAAQCTNGNYIHIVTVCMNTDEQALMAGRNTAVDLCGSGGYSSLDLHVENQGEGSPLIPPIPGN